MKILRGRWLNVFHRFVAFDLWARKTFEGIEQIEKPISIFSVVVYSPRISTSCRQEVARQYRIAVRQLEEELDQLVSENHLFKYITDMNVD